MAEIENRDSLRQTTGDKLNETGRQTHKLRNGQMLNEHLLKIKIGMYRIIILSYMYLERCSLPEKKDEIGVHVLAIFFFSPSS
jgi:hypothetical protein